ncbi:MAG: glycosyltransferase [Proteobacteria bacterium]|nr:glycosyltransferase [Pseudomonadota bacterium]
MDFGKQMKFQFFYTKLSLGGVETFIVRLANWLVQNGSEVRILLIERGDLDESLDSRVNLRYIGSKWRAFSPIGNTKFCRQIPRDVHAVCAFDPLSFVMATSICRILPITKPFFLGVYHPRIYCFSQRFSVIETIRRLLLESYVKPESLVFMNQACLRAHESCLRLPLTESMVLPVALPTITPRTVKPVPGKIVSVGRLQPFKSYNLYMIDIVNQLVKKGMHNLSWHVYGYGMLEDEMREKVRRFGLQDHIFLHGAVTYADFRSVVEDAHLFIGMGTSLIEAGMIGVPGVPAIDSAGPVSYGYTHDLNGYDVGEQSNVSPNQSVMELIEKIYQMTEENYKYVEAKTIEHCNRFGIKYVGPEFLRSIDALGMLCKPSRYETALIWMHFVVLTLILCRDIIHGGFVNLAKWTLPRRFIPWARRLNRAWLGRRGFDELARHCKQETKSGS